uniref:Uncharacterized protein n=1 Tax=Oryza sativa subsp. japonica TaxID=39947 RepID=Q6F2U0_ORYSJ|nr:hypothetical protein [Oryza sativa Japonica Group]
MSLMTSPICHLSLFRMNMTVSRCVSKHNRLGPKLSYSFKFAPVATVGKLNTRVSRGWSLGQRGVETPPESEDLTRGIDDIGLAGFYAPLAEDRRTYKGQVSGADSPSMERQPPDSSTHRRPAGSPTTRGRPPCSPTMRGRPPGSPTTRVLELGSPSTRGGSPASPSTRGRSPRSHRRAASRPASSVSISMDYHRIHPTGFVPLTVWARVPIRIKFGAIKLWKMTGKATCNLVVDNLVAGRRIQIRSNNYSFKLKV